MMSNHERMYGPVPDELYRRRVREALRRINETGHVNGKTEAEWAALRSEGEQA